MIVHSEGNLLGPTGLIKQLTKALAERMLEGELSHHLGYQKHDPAGNGSGNSAMARARRR